jgi:hypothetical protein
MFFSIYSEHFYIQRQTGSRKARATLPPASSGGAEEDTTPVGADPSTVGATTSAADEAINGAAVPAVPQLLPVGSPILETNLDQESYLTPTFVT